MTAGYLDRIRYLGALDDELLRARSLAAEPPDVTFVNLVLAQEVLFGVPLALNDGHLFHYEAGRQALTDREASPLLDLVERGYVTILSRNGDLADMPLEMRHIPSYQRLVTSSDWLFFHQRLRETQRLLKEGFNLARWPSADMGAGFARLLKLSVDNGGTIQTLVQNGVNPDQTQELVGRFEDRIQNVGKAAARSIWNSICDAATLDAPARLALRWLALETYHHNFAMTMSERFRHGSVGVVTRCSDIFGFTHEDPWVAQSTGALPHELPLLRLKPEALTQLPNWSLLADVVTPGSRLNRAKTDYIVSLSMALADRASLPVARGAADEYSRRLAEHFGMETKRRTETALNIVTAAFGAVAGAVIGLAASGPPGAVVGSIGGQAVAAGIVAAVGGYIPMLAQRIKIASGHSLVGYVPTEVDVQLSRRIRAGEAFSSVTLSEAQVSTHTAALPVY